MSCADCHAPLPAPLGPGRPRLRCHRCAILREAARWRDYKRRIRAAHWGARP